MARAPAVVPVAEGMPYQSLPKTETTPSVCTPADIDR
jgi:hypothetical protein